MIFSSRGRAMALRGISIVYWCFVAVMLYKAAADRFSLPKTPFSDPDTWGYLFPGLSLLDGGGFVHTAGRGFPYPLFIYGLLKSFGTFTAISVTQHLLGLGAGLLLVAAWERGISLLKAGFASSVLHRVLGLAMLQCFWGAKTSVLLEHSIRPESIFPFFTILAAWLGTEYTVAFWHKKNLRLSFVLGLFLVLDSFFVYFLKPAWGFGVGFAILPVLLSLVRLKGHWPYKLAILGIPVAITMATLWYPEKVLVQKYDKTSDEFLPSLLLCFNAHIVRNELVAELDGKQPLAYDRKLVEMTLGFIDAELAANHYPGVKVANVQHQAKPSHYTILGYDPDNLLYKHDQPTCLMIELMNHFGEDTKGYADFCFHYYKSAWLHQPGAMTGKVWKQFWGFYNMGASPYGNTKGAKIEMGQQAPRTLSSVDVTQAKFPGFKQYVADVQKQVGSTQVWKQTKTASREQKYFQSVYLASLLVSLLIGVLAFAKRAEFGEWTGPALWTLYLFGFNLGNVMTIAVAHTVQVSRYVQNQLVFTLLAESAGILLLVALAEAIIVKAVWGGAKPEEKAEEARAVVA